MKKLYAPIIIALWVILGSCATPLMPVADPNPAPDTLGVYTLETTACGLMRVGTNACVLPTGSVNPAGEIDIRVPRTNTTNQAATLNIFSSDCNIQMTETGAPGQMIPLLISNLLKGAPLNQSCSIEFTLTPIWDNQSQLQFVTHPLLGRVLLLALPYAPTSLTDNGSTETLGYFDLTQTAGAGHQEIRSDASLANLSIDTQGSSLGQILLVGCGMSAPLVQSYTNPNPTLPLPRVTQSCIYFGTVQRVDAASPLSFAISVEVLPTSYVPLPPPALTSASQGSTDSSVSAIDFGTSVSPGGTFTVPKNLVPAEYDLRQITTSGRYTLSHVKAGAIEWNLP